MRVRLANLPRIYRVLGGGLVASLVTPAAAYAHTGVGGNSGLLAGALHPWSGLDHLCAMVAVGLWAAQRGGKSLWAVPLAFLSVMTVGGALGVAGVSLPGVEPGIAASVLVFGLVVATAVEIPFAATTALVALFALFHGHAHGVEMPATASGLAFAAGFLAAAAILHVVGIGLAIVCQRLGSTTAMRLTGGAIAAYGLCLMLF